jgi:translation initiation factor IF-1
MVTKPGSVAVALALAVGLLVVAPACAPHSSGLEGVVVPRGRSEVVYGEIRSVDARSRRIQLRGDRGRDRTVRYDNRTRVVYGSRQFSPSALERGDVVQVRLSYDRGGTAWAERVEVRESVRDRRVVASRRVERVEGTVRRLDLRRGYFTVEPKRARPVVVRVPSRLDRNDARRFERLRPGDRVKVDVRPIDRDAAELVRFR